MMSSSMSSTAAFTKGGMMAIGDDSQSRLFLLGKIAATPDAISRTTEEERSTFLLRHQIGSWEESSREDRMANWLALFHGLRIFTVHRSRRGLIWIITEADRSLTTIITPEEY